MWYMLIFACEDDCLLCRGGLLSHSPIFRRDKDSY